MYRNYREPTNKVKPGTQKPSRVFFFARLRQRNKPHPCGRINYVTLVLLTCLLAYTPGSLQCSGDNRPGDLSRNHPPTSLLRPYHSSASHPRFHHPHPPRKRTGSLQCFGALSETGEIELPAPQPAHPHHKPSSTRP